MRNIFTGTKIQGAGALLALLLMTASVAQAAIVYQILGSGTGNSTNDWANGAVWNDGQPATAANPAAATNDYYCGRDENLAPLPATPTNNLRAVNDGTFGGRSLNISAPQNLSMRSATTGVGSSYTIADLRLTSGTITQNATNGIAVVNGKITLGTPASTCSINSNGGIRVSTYNSLITGACARLNLSMGNNVTDSITFTNTANDFTVTTVTQTGGIWVLAGSGAAGHISKLVSGGTIRPSAALTIQNTDVTLTTNTTVCAIDLAFPVKIKSLKVTDASRNLVPIANGVYHASDLTPLYPNQFTGTSTLEIGPAPAATKEWTVY